MVECVALYTMGLNIKNTEVENLAAELARSTGVSKTEAIRVALLERRERLGIQSVNERVTGILGRFAEIRGDRRLKPLTKQEWDEINEI
jgi:hypothetical protein